MTFTKIDPADFDSPRQELSNGGLKSVVTLLVRWQIVFLSAQTLTLNPAVMASPSYGRLKLRSQNGQKGNISM